LLLEELGLKDFEPEEDLSFIVNLSDVKSTNRADAEYFQPKYEKFEKILSKFKQEKLADLSSLISYGTVPTSPYVEKEGVPYVKGENLRNCFIDYSKLVYLEKESTKELPKKFYLKEGDIVISQMGTVGRAGLVTKKEEGWLFASFTIRVRLKEENRSILDPLFVASYIQNISRPYYLLRRIAQASVRQNTDLPTIKDLRIPIMPQSTQQKIADLVRQSHEARKKAKDLLEEAKQKVEKMILGKG
jgi:restriction endonuclease S subunit